MPQSENVIQPDVLEEKIRKCEDHIHTLKSALTNNEHQLAFLKSKRATMPSNTKPSQQ